MAKKKQQEQPEKCNNCIHARPTFDRLTPDGKPILAQCPYMERKVLLSYDSCNKHEKEK